MNCMNQWSACVRTVQVNAQRSAAHLVEMQLHLQPKLLTQSSPSCLHQHLLHFCVGYLYVGYTGPQPGSPPPFQGAKMFKGCRGQGPHLGAPHATIKTRKKDVVLATKVFWGSMGCLGGCLGWFTSA
uniref:Uncharacterized protein n=1 Tax=Eutreptiella gymnastica TaxID=73025 RepID=A0A7S4D376_9EUGL